jgi:hypothetical protein
MAGGEVMAFARKGLQVLITVFTFHPGITVMQIAAIEITENDV